jgi:Zn-dependent protease
MGIDIMGLLMATPFFIMAITFHEFMHAWTADRLGDPTPRAMGRLTLDPRAHFDLLGAIMFVVSALSGLFFGWAKPVPVNHFNFRHPRRDMALVGIAGPMSNFLQSIGWYIIFFIFSMYASDYSSGDQLLLSFLATGVMVNIILLCFNIIPIPPLDGSRVLAWILPPRQAAALDRMEAYGFLILMLLLFTGILGIIYRPLIHLVARLFPGINFNF